MEHSATAPGVRLALTGDVMLGRLVDGALARFGPAYPWGDVLPLLRAADLTILNLECVIAAQGRPWRRWPKTFHFRAAPVAIEALTLAGVDAVSLANNHVLDFEVEALLEMLDRLDAAGIAHAGAGRSLEEAMRPAVLDARGLRVGLVGLTDNEPGWRATEAAPGTFHVPVSLEPGTFGQVEAALAAARAAGCAFVILSAHWGPNMRERPPAEFRAFARAAIDAGADLFLGHSAHIWQGVGVHRGRPIFYDAGDFVDDYAVDPWLRNDRSALVQVTVAERAVAAVELIPVVIDNCQVNLAWGAEAGAIAARIVDLSAEFGTRFERRGEGLALVGLD